MRRAEITETTRLLRGAGRFSDDVRIDGALFGAFVRSTHAHARIDGIAVADARAAPGVAAIITARDIAAAKVGNISRPQPQTGKDGRPLVVPHRPALAGERVVHVGEPIALVVAESAAAAADAAERVAIDYAPLPAVTGAVAALMAGAPQIWPEAPGNRALDYVAPDAEAEAAVARIIAQAPHVVRLRVVNQRISGMPLEPRGGTALFQDGRFTLHAPSQSAHALKAQLCAILGIEPDALSVISGDVGGSFGLKTAPYPEHAALLVAAKMLGRPVHWMASRSEAFLSDNQARDQVSEATLALDGDGRFLALSVAAIANLGGYVSAAGASIASNNFAICFPGMYDIPHVSVAVKLAFTNTVPTGPYRGAGRPEANYVMERVVDAAARQLGIDPVALRRRNLVARSAMPYRSALANVYDSGDFTGVLASAAEHACVAGLAARRAAARARGRLRGVGISCFLEHAGGGTEGALLDIVDGTLVVRLGVHASGQGHATIFRDLVAERLDIAPDRIRVEQGDSNQPIRGRPAVGSRSSNAVGSAVTVAVKQLVATGSALTASLFSADEEAITYQSGFFQVQGTNHRLSLFELADRLAEAGTPDALRTLAHNDAVTTYPNGCHIAEIEIDPDTGRIAVVGYVAVDDCGVVLNETLAEAQVVGAAVQGMGQALMEALVYDADGQLVTGTLLDYAVPRAADVPDIEAVFHPVPATTNALGVKGLGEAGTTAAIAAIMNAVADAVPGGAAIDMPATPEKIWRACRETE